MDAAKTKAFIDQNFDKDFLEPLKVGCCPTTQFSFSGREVLKGHIRNVQLLS